MKGLLLLVGALISFLSVCQSQEPVAVAQPQSNISIEVFFSPKGGCTDAIVREIKNAKTGILIQAYSFTSAPIAKALVDAHNGA